MSLARTGLRAESNLLAVWRDGYVYDASVREIESSVLRRGDTEAHRVGFGRSLVESNERQSGQNRSA